VHLTTMKNTLNILIIIIYSCLNVYAANTISNSRVSEVTIYRSYAKETRIGNTLVPEGNSEIIINNITNAIDENSIQVGCKNGVKILSVSTRINFTPKVNPNGQSDIKMWQDSIKILDRRARFIIKQKEAYNTELDVLNNNNKLGTEKDGLKPDALRILLDLNRLKLLELKKLLFDADENYTELQSAIAKLNNQISQTSGQNIGTNVREIVLKVHAATAMQTQFKISYLATAASWTPTYELRCENTSKPLQLFCRAKIVQNTGYDWRDAKIKLSTANPNQNHNRPILYPIYVDFMQPDYYNAQMKYKSLQNSYSAGNMMQEASKPAAPAAAQMMSLSNESDDANFIDGMKLEADKVTVSEGDMMVEYEIDNAQDIESDNQEHIIGIQEITLPAIYNYHSVPKLDNGTFLIARVTDWGKYNLLAGDATMFFDDMYVGKSYINPNISSDTLLLSLGRDEKINAKRVKLNEFCSSKKLSNKKRETKAYETTIKNNKNTPVEIELLDQFPISRNEAIEVTLDESSNAEITKDYGKLLWRITLKPGESKKVRVIYTLKFPDDKLVSEKN
jgi:uncharacterized protein (TIGR02231 family)